MIITACVILVLYWVPKIQVASLRNAKRVEPQDVFKAENDARATLAQILGGFAVLVGLYFAWTNITATKEEQITDRFYKAIEQLGAADGEGKPKPELRLGGIYALERIARDSERDHWPIMEVLTAYVREHAKHNTRPGALDLAADIRAIITVIRRREWRYEKSGQTLDLREADLHLADLKGAHLKGATLAGAHLENADLTGAHLEVAILIGAQLTGAHLEDAHLDRALLDEAHLEGAHLNHAHLAGASLGGAHLAGAGGVIQEQINSARGDATTKLPPHIDMPESWAPGRCRACAQQYGRASKHQAE
jgi:hypothetical protein